jgi:O-antigen ligase
MKAVISSVYPYLFLFFCFILPLDKYATAAPNLILIALIVLFPFVIKKRHLLKLKSIPFIILGLLILMVLLNSIIFNEFQQDIPIIRKVLSSFLIIVLFLPLENTKKILKAIIISVLFCMVASLINLYGFYISEGAFNFASGAHIDDVLVVDRL